MNVIVLGIIGCGRATRRLHLPALQTLPMIKVAALADVDPSALSQTADRCQLVRRYQDARDLVGDPELDAVAICTPAHSHADLAVMALTAGKHVLVEKPLAVTLTDGERMMQAAGESRKVAAIGFNLRCHRLARRARTMIAAGALGQVRQIVTTWGSPMQHGPDFPEWRRHLATGGGALFEISVHHIDLCRFLLDDEIDTVRVLEHSAVCEYESVSLLARTRAGVLITSAFCQVTSNINEIRIVGDRGTVFFSFYRAESFSFSRPEQPHGGLRARWDRLPRLREWPELLGVARAGGDYRLSYQEEWKLFAAAVHGGQPPAGSFADGFAALKVMHVALESIR